MRMARFLARDSERRSRCSLRRCRREGGKKKGGGRHGDTTAAAAAAAAGADMGGGSEAFMQGFARAGQ